MTCGRIISSLACLALVAASDIQGNGEFLAPPAVPLATYTNVKETQMGPDVFAVEWDEPVQLADEADSCKSLPEGCGTINYVKAGGWMLMIAMMFFAQHHVCDAYFVPAINVFVRQMKNSPSKAMQRWGEEAVAGATICALGCNGPELFSNLISLFTHSDAGIGVVVGSEIFNLLVIVGAATLCAPTQPLTLERAPFMRDVIFYALSIGLLYWTLMDKAVQFHEACVLLGAAVVYVCTVYFTTDIEEKIAGGKTAVLEDANASDKKKGKMHGVDVEIEEIVHSRMADSHHGKSSMWTLDPTEAGIYAEQTNAVKQEKGKGNGNKATSRASIGFQFDAGDPMLGNMLRYKDLKEVMVLGEGIIELEFQPNFFSHVSLKLTVPSSEQRDKLLAMIEKYSLGRTWVHKYDAGPMDSINHFTHTIKDKNESCMGKIMAIPHLIIDLLLKLTLSTVDVKDINKEGRWAMCFLGSMFWLATFSFFMLETANMINWNMPMIPISFLGITVCAVGTSFPNAVASIIMAQQNKPAAAIANALGSNVQNVFLAMALPWVIYSSYQLGCAPIPQNVVGINEGVVWMVFTLALLVFFAMMPGSFTLMKWHGYVLCFFYLVYLAITSCEAFGLMEPLMA